MTKEDIFHDYQLICKMKAPIDLKVVMLSHLITSHSNPWRVVGITKEALLVFSNHKFRKVAKMGINRSHVNNRSQTYKAMMAQDFNNCDEWWNFYYEKDRTVLATSSENIRNTLSEIYDVSENFGLFRFSGYGWRHGKDEIKFLEKLHQEKITILNIKQQH